MGDRDGDPAIPSHLGSCKFDLILHSEAIGGQVQLGDF